MGNESEPRTRATLLARLCQSGGADQEAWSEFVHIYGRHIYKWCRYWQLQDADAQEVTQRVLLLLVQKMKDFVYDPTKSFRAWLKTVTHNAWRNLIASQQRLPVSGNDTGFYERLNSVPAREDLIQRLEYEFDHELLEQAMLRVRLRVATHTWEAFRLTAIDGLSAVEVAQRLDMKIASVYVAKSKVRKFLKEETESLEKNGPSVD